MEENKEKVEDTASEKEEVKQDDVVVEEKEVEINDDEIEVEKEDELQSLNEHIAKLESEIDGLKNDYARAYADTENMRRRLQTEYEMLKKYRIQDFALDILPVIDNCERALAQETSDEKYRKGVEMIYNQLINALKKEGVEEIDCLNKTFDANFEQAIMMEKVDGVESGIVVQVLQKGYKLKDRILRAAMVKVSE